MSLNTITQLSTDSGNLLKQISRHCPFGLMSLNPNLEVLEVNEAFCELLGMPLEQILYKSLWSLFPDWPRNQITQALHKEQSYQVEGLPVERLCLRQWQQRFWNICLWSIPGNLSSTNGYVLSAIDTTSQVENRWQKEDLIVTLAHDLKVPLTGCDRLLELLLERLDGCDQHRLLSQLKTSNQEALHLTHNVLSLFSAGQNTQTYRYTQVDLNDTIKQILEELAVLAEGKKLRINVLAPAGSVIISADLMAIRRLLINLVHNAIKFSFNQGSIDITISHDQRHAIIDVTDKGPGISCTDQKYLFQRFSPSRRNQSEFAGSGLGLYVCHSIVQAHQGNIACLSSPGMGSTFTVRLPLK